MTGISTHGTPIEPAFKECHFSILKSGKVGKPVNKVNLGVIRIYDTVSDVVESKVHQWQQNSDA